MCALGVGAVGLYARYVTPPATPQLLSATPQLCAASVGANHSQLRRILYGLANRQSIARNEDARQRLPFERFIKDARWTRLFYFSSV